MSYPFGSGGMPQPNNQHPDPSHQYPAQPFGVGYPQGGQPSMPGFPQPGYAGGGVYGGFPHQQQQQPYPPAQQIPPAQQYPPAQHYPPQPYPPQPQHYGGVPAAGVAYPSMPQFGVPQPQTPAGYPPFGQQPAPPSGGGYPYYQQQQQQQQRPPVHYGQRPGGSAGAAVSHLPKGQPTLRPAADFNATEDAQRLRKAMKGFGTDEDGLIAVLCHRSNDQIQQIKSAYKTNFGRDLLEDVRSETSGRFEDVLAALLLPRLDYYVKELNDAMAGLGTDEDALIEVLCSLSNYEIQAIKHHYKQVYYKDLETELIGETSGHFKRLLVSLCVGGRDESGQVDAVAAQRDATALLQAGELMMGTDESVFNTVLCQRGYTQIRLVCEEYQKVTGHSLVKAIEKEFSGDIRDGLVAVVQCMTNKAEFFAARLHKSMAGLGTTDSQLIRVIVMRAEVDLYDVKVAFERLYGKSLRSWIKGDTSGHYKHALYHLIGETETK